MKHQFENTSADTEDVLSTPKNEALSAADERRAEKKIEQEAPTPEKKSERREQDESKETAQHSLESVRALVAGRLGGRPSEWVHTHSEVLGSFNGSELLDKKNESITAKIKNPEWAAVHAASLENWSSGGVDFVEFPDKEQRLNVSVSWLDADGRTVRSETFMFAPEVKEEATTTEQATQAEVSDTYGSSPYLGNELVEPAPELVSKSAPEVATEQEEQPTFWERIAAEEASQSKETEVLDLTSAVLEKSPEKIHSEESIDRASLSKETVVSAPSEEIKSDESAAPAPSSDEAPEPIIAATKENESLPLEDPVVPIEGATTEPLFPEEIGTATIEAADMPEATAASIASPEPVSMSTDEPGESSIVLPQATEPRETPLAPMVEFALADTEPRVTVERSVATEAEPSARPSEIKPANSLEAAQLPDEEGQETAAIAFPEVAAPKETDAETLINDFESSSDDYEREPVPSAPSVIPEMPAAPTQPEGPSLLDAALAELPPVEHSDPASGRQQEVRPAGEVVLRAWQTPATELGHEGAVATPEQMESAQQRSLSALTDQNADDEESVAAPAASRVKKTGRLTAAA
jgi:hypothetical protein